MNSVKYLQSILEKLSNEFENIEIRYEFSKLSFLHKVEIKPLELFESDSFFLKEINIDEEFSKKFPREELLFISENSLCEVTSPCFVLPSLTEDNTIYENILERINEMNKEALTFLPPLSYDTKSTNDKIEESNDLTLQEAA